jgi:hypothetical protein
VSSLFQSSVTSTDASIAGSGGAEPAPGLCTFHCEGPSCFRESQPPCGLVALSVLPHRLDIEAIRVVIEESFSNTTKPPLDPPVNGGKW